MSARLPAHALDAVAQKWRALAERRRAHFLDLYDSGRWRRYYNEERFLYRMREAAGLAERWAEIARGRWVNLRRRKVTPFLTRPPAPLLEGAASRRWLPI